jgi:hypothetical protein
METLKITKSQKAALIWALNIFEATSEGTEGELLADYEAALKALAPLYTKLTAELDN